jgi:thiamine-phosphate pyrophosphorylase
MDLGKVGLYLITDGLVADSLVCSDDTVDRLSERIESALKGGVRLVQLREKGLDRETLLRLAKKIRALTLRYSAGLILNCSTEADLKVALLAHADGVHLPRSGPGIKSARDTLGNEALIGTSTHSVEEAVRAEEDGADFVTFGPVFQTESKKEYGAPLGVQRLREAVGAVSIPVFALGGIGLSRVNEVLLAGAAGVGLISAIMSAPDIEAAAREIILRIDNRDKTECTKRGVSRGTAI